MRHVSSSFIEFHQVSSRPWLDCIPSPYSQPNAGVSMSVVSREEVSTNCRNLQLRPSAPIRSPTKVIGLLLCIQAQV